MPLETISSKNKGATRNQLGRKDYFSTSPDRRGNAVSTIDTITQKKYNHFTTTSSTNFSLEYTNSASNLGKKVQLGLKEIY